MTSAATTISEPTRDHLRWMLVSGVGPATFTRLLETFGDAQKALGASAAELSRIKGISPAGADGIARQRDQVDIQVEIDAALEHGVRIIGRPDPEYPAGLRDMPDSPIVLYVKGELRPEDAVAVAIVGTRRCSIYGSEQARRFGELLAGAGFTVVSGLARGIDAFAHHGAVDAGGRSVAVLGSGLSSIYPPENAPLAERLIQNGACITEYPMRLSVRASNFLVRNRIIAGMTLGTLVVEAPARSGALSTARFAREYNREVFALPGRAGDATAIGVNGLIRDGAKLTMTLEDIVSELGDVGAALQRRPSQPGASAAQPTFDFSLTAEQRRVWEATSTEARSSDQLSSEAELPIGSVLSALTALELRGLVKRLPGQMVKRIQ